MIQVPAEPFLPMHEEILDELSKPGSFYICCDPDELWAPYLGDMQGAGWLSHTYSHFGLIDRFYITDAGRERLELQRLGEWPMDAE